MLGPVRFVRIIKHTPNKNVLDSVRFVPKRLITYWQLLSIYSHQNLFPSNITIDTPSEILQELGILKFENLENSATQNIISILVFLSCFCIFTLDT